MYPSYNLNPLLRRRHQQLVEAQAFNQWLADRRLRQDGETYADELGRMTWPLVETRASPKSMAVLCDISF